MKNQPDAFFHNGIVQGVGSVAVLVVVEGYPGSEHHRGTAVFDIGMTPVYFVVAADGTVERGYTLAL